MERDPTRETPPSKSKNQVWQELILRQAGSGQKVQAFCRAQGINYRVFYYWKKKFGDSRPTRSRNSGSAAPGIGSSATDRFIAVSRPTPGVAALPRIHLPNGVRVELGGGLESPAVSRFILNLCGVSPPAKEVRGAKP